MRTSFKLAIALAATLAAAYGVARTTPYWFAPRQAAQVDIHDPALIAQGQYLSRAADCAACHTAYAPGLLPARSWQRIMAGLDKHYGTDASLDDATVKQLSAWLQANAGTYKRVVEEPPEDRITRSAWFQRKHRELDPTIWKQAAVKSAANCMACHSGAEKGRFDDDELRFPAGLDARYRRHWDQD